MEENNLNTTNTEIQTNITQENTINEVPEKPIGENNAALISPEKKEEKKSHKGLIIGIVIIILILLILLIAGYILEFKTANKRLTAITNGFFDNIKINNVKNKIKNEQSGNYNIELDAKLKQDKNELLSGNIKFNGNYGLDIKNKDTYLTLDLENLVLNKESYLGTTDINTSAEIDNNTVYVGIKELFDKTIKYEDENVSDFWSELEKELENDSSSKYNIEEIINAIKIASTTAITSVPNKQKIQKIDELGTINVITITNSKENEKIMYTTFIASLKNNNEFIKFYATVKNENETKAKEELQDLIDNYKNEELSFTTLEVYTPLFKNEFSGIKIKGIKAKSTNCYSKANNISIIKNETNYNININMPKELTGKLLLNISSGEENTYKISGTINYINTKETSNECETLGEDVYYIDLKIGTKNTSKEQSLKISLAGEYTPYTTEKSTSKTYTAEVEFIESNTIDETYTKSNINKDKALNLESLTSDDISTIMTNLNTNFGKIGTLITYFVSLTSSNSNSSEINYNDYGI